MESKNTETYRTTFFEGEVLTDPAGGEPATFDRSPEMSNPLAQPAGSKSKSKSSASKQDAKDKASDLADRAKDTAETGKEKASEIADTAEHKADAAIDKSAGELHKAAQKARAATEDRDDALGTIGTQAADALDKSANYLEMNDSEQMLEDLEAFIRRRPAESLLIAAGVGFLFARAVR